MRVGQGGSLLGPSVRRPAGQTRGGLQREVFLGALNRGQVSAGSFDGDGKLTDARIAALIGSQRQALPRWTRRIRIRGQRSGLPVPAAGRASGCRERAASCRAPRLRPSNRGDN